MRTPVCPVTCYIFLNFPLTTKSEDIDADIDNKVHISYSAYRNALSRWMPPFVGAANAEPFLQLYGTKSGRAGGATAVAYKAGVPEVEWKAHGN